MENVGWLSLFFALVTVAGIMIIGRRLKRETSYRVVYDANSERLRCARLEIDNIDTSNRRKPYRLIPLNGLPISAEDLDYLQRIETWQKARLSNRSGRTEKNHEQLNSN